MNLSTTARRISTFFYLRPRLTLFTLLAPVLIWLGVVYFGAILALLVRSLNYLDGFTGTISTHTVKPFFMPNKELTLPVFTFKTYNQLFTKSNLEIVQRTFIMAAAVTLACGLLAFPLSYYMGRYASYRVKGALYLLVMIPLWSSYLVRVYSWKLILAQEGVFTWMVDKLGLWPVLDKALALPVIGGSSLSFSYLGTFLVFVYIWMPYMILPITASVERVPRSLIDASSDLGARPGYTFRKIVFPLVFPGVVAGSIFTFSLTLGDYIIPNVVGNSRFFIGSVVLSQQGTAGNIPLAAAFTSVPIVIMAVYLLIARKLGAFDAL